MMKKLLTLLLPVLLVSFFPVSAQTPVPNGSFESWVTVGNYTNPEFWDTPNEELMSIPFFGTSVVTKSTDHYGNGSYSARLETKHILVPPIDAPGFITLGNLTLDIVNMTYSMTGGAPVFDQPTHLKGFYKFSPKGGDSCLVGIGLFKTEGGIRDSIAYGQFSTKDTVPDWTPFSIWIDYDVQITPDTMNIFAFSTAQEVISEPGTVLYLDDLYLDYTVAVHPTDPSAGISTYHDRETRRFLVFFGFPSPEDCAVTLYDLRGMAIQQESAAQVTDSRIVLDLNGLPPSVYLVAITHNNQTVTKKIVVN